MLASEKKTLKSDFKALKIAIILPLTLFVGVFFIIKPVSADNIFFDDFETYIIGIENLNGQGNWEILPPTPLSSSSDVIFEETYSGLQAILIDKFDRGIRNGTELATGTFSFWFKLKDYTTGNGGSYIDFNFKELATTTENALRIVCYAGQNCFENGLSVEALGFAPGFTNFATSTPYIWNNVIIEWRANSNEFRFKLNEENFTAWVSYSTFNKIGRLEFLGIRSITENDLQLYVDLISESSTTGYIISELGLPELPELEECEGLGVTDRLLCEIKNFFQRLFVPSPDKITELRTTLDLIKTKFPYNYVLGIRDFFIYLKDNINEDQDINISILGQAGIVDFSFWNTTTTIAGVSKTISDIFKLFFSFMLIMVFVFWSFSFLRKVFK